MSAKPYVGRFAPSPSGPLHLGSLVAAVGSYLQARSQQGQWLVRIEDIDPPREQAGASKVILKQLEQFGLHWDSSVLYQSQRLTAYQQQIDQWLYQQAAYYCQCTRKQIKAAGGYYLGTCRDLTLHGDNCATRLSASRPIYSFNDQLAGEVIIPKALAEEDFIIKRRDGLYAYNLAVSLDDAEQGITEVVRGADIILTTGRQLAIFELLAKAAPNYLHLPLVLDEHGNKLSKQNHAPSISGKQNQQLLLQALRYLGQASEAGWLELSCEQILNKALANWQLSAIPKISLHSQ
ncbi:MULTISPECIES: tRNA glutamyl-Q(34) synthetase GluQRS [unclassified Agarivorans]|uniref:tRNA glutamyl-Q(34) synthetase GluQRS n=1 Tax=unclassified Agarivorans TaxID=2636026 RepID=UPI0026E3FE4A|nr:MULTISPECIES: tRNA glutamyl-Q(34) synthetase GluQRS [unclassified Agarivorans]MDO6687694.1 tRNA glutamyl-Q(34) synthetase GluQRS [Agarivorans sp. 3_MG-2023]MDO6717305.1 tRNA glutamyl-Q(34) synthetase GluQRS [Agarivorans sp. 2_MG-2023]